MISLEVKYTQLLFDIQLSGHQLCSVRMQSISKLKIKINNIRFRLINAEHLHTILNDIKYTIKNVSSFEWCL